MFQSGSLDGIPGVRLRDCGDGGQPEVHWPGAAQEEGRSQGSGRATSKRFDVDYHSGKNIY